MIPNIQQLAQFLDRGTLKSNKFLVRIIGKGWNKDFTAIQVNVPNLSITFEYSFLNDRFVFAPKEIEGQDLMITFIDNAQREVYKFFFKQIFEMCYNFEIPRLRKFHDEIKFDRVEVIPLDRENQPQTPNIFEDVVPYDVADLNFSANEEGKSIFVAVKFKYSFHRLG